MAKPQPTTKMGIARELELAYDTLRRRRNGLFSSDVIRFFSHQYVEYKRYGTCDEPQQHLIEDGFADPFLEWCAWETAYSTLNEALNNLALVANSFDSLYGEGAANFRATFPSLGPGYISGPLLATLYYAHFKTCIAGLCLAGVVPSNKVFLLRNADTSPKWQPTDGKWKDSKAGRFINQAQVLREYDAVRRQAQWLPNRAPELNALKGERERVMYHANRMGSNYFLDCRTKIRAALPIQLQFTRELGGLLGQVISKSCQGGNYEPIRRFKPFEKRYGTVRDAWREITSRT